MLPSTVCMPSTTQTTSQVWTGLIHTTSLCHRSDHHPHLTGEDTRALARGRTAMGAEKPDLSPGGRARTQRPFCRRSVVADPCVGPAASERRTRAGIPGGWAAVSPTEAQPWRPRHPGPPRRRALSTKACVCLPRRPQRPRFPYSEP